MYRYLDIVNCIHQYQWKGMVSFFTSVDAEQTDTNMLIIKKDPLHVLNDANVLVLIDADQNIFVNGRFSLPSGIHRPIIYA